MIFYRFDVLLRQILPTFCILFFMVVNRVINEGWGYWGEISPWIVLICVWYWAIFRPIFYPFGLFSSLVLSRIFIALTHLTAPIRFC